MKNDFNRVAKWYQVIANLVFGAKLIQAQKINFDALQKGQKVLWVGGGDGELLKYIDAELNLEIDYVELSSQMIELASAKANTLHVNFIQSDVLKHSGEYDVIILNFFLDCFTQEELPHVINHLASMLTSNGALTVTDFAPPKSSKDRLLLWAMHKFFRLFSNLESRALQPINKVIIENGFDRIEYQEKNNPRLFMALYRPISPKPDK